MPDRWLQLSEGAEDELRTRWVRAVLEAVAKLGRSETVVDVSDSRGLDRLIALAEYAPHDRPYQFKCVATSAAIAAVAETNPGLVVQIVNGNRYLSVHHAWSGMLLHVEEPSVIEASVANSLRSAP